MPWPMLPVIVLSVLAQTGPGMPPGRPQDWVGQEGRWKQVGAALMAKAPAEVRNGDPYAKLRYLYNAYTDLLIQHNVPLNYRFEGRVANLGSDWACSSHATNLSGLFQGSGLTSLQMVFVRGAKSSTLASLKAGVNSDHGALFVILDGTALVFDPWLPAFLTTKTYSNSMQREFGGLPYPLWTLVMRQLQYDLFVCSEPSGQAIPWQKSPELALSRDNITVTDDPKPSKPARPIHGPHWRLERIACSTDSLLATGEVARAVGTYQNRIWSWVYKRVGAEPILVRTRVDLSHPETLSFLTPGTASLVLRITEDGPSGYTERKGYADLGWSHEGADGRSLGRNKDSAYVGYDRKGFLSPKEAGPYLPTLNHALPVPAGQPGARFVFYAATGMGAVHYHFVWSGAGSAAAVVQKPSFEGRWKTEWGVIELVVRDRQVKGTYPHDAGRIEGQLSSDRMSFKGIWKEAPTFLPPKDQGELEFQLSEDGTRFQGRYWYGARKPGDPGKSWMGQKITGSGGTP